MVRELERELAAPLLSRSTTGVAATPQGRVLYDHARSVNRELADALAQIAQLSGRMSGELSVGAVPLAVLLLVPEAMRTFGQEFPAIQLRVREELYIAQLTWLRSGEVDVALGPIPEGLPAGEFHVEPLMPIEMAVVVGRGNPLARARSLAELADARWVYTSASGHTGYARLLFETHGLVPPAPAAMVNSNARAAGADRPQRLRRPDAAAHRPPPGRRTIHDGGADPRGPPRPHPRRDGAPRRDAQARGAPLHRPPAPGCGACPG